ncbi:MAG: methyltransferase domain-containing protein [Spirochaetales bacterium]|nr:methyltransferase domain-containing protein [Spirochaetales bacterium]
MHEKRVEQFYSSGLRKDWGEYDYPEPDDERYNSFGYWYRNTRNYVRAAENLIDFFIASSDIEHVDRLLNVACGYGTESFEYFRKWTPEEVIGIDVTKVHTDYANNKAKALSLDDRLKFCHGDACVLNFPEAYFSHIMGIEGPANFKTRECFFSAAHRVLKKNGEMILADIILGKNFRKRNLFQKQIMKLIVENWHIPDENWVNEEEYRRQLHAAGFKIVFIKRIGNSVFPGYSRNVFRTEALKYCFKMRGLMTTIGFTVISGLLGYLYNKGFIEYIYVKVRKE